MDPDVVLKVSGLVVIGDQIVRDARAISLSVSHFLVVTEWMDQSNCSMQALRVTEPELPPTAVRIRRSSSQWRSYG